jgi:uncharacterized protein (DUF433 family)
MHDNWQKRIVIDPKILAGQPVIRGTRISLEFILDLLANGWTIDHILDDYIQLKREDIMAALKYASEIVKGAKVIVCEEPLPDELEATKEYDAKKKNSSLELIPWNAEKKGSN